MTKFILIAITLFSTLGLPSLAFASTKGTVYISGSKLERKMVQQGSTSGGYHSPSEVTPFLAVPANESVDDTMSALPPLADDMAYGCQATYRWNNLSNDGGGVSFVMFYQMGSCSPIRVKDIPDRH